MAGLIYNNPKLAFWLISLLWIILSGVIWGPVTLLFKHRYDRANRANKERIIEEERDYLLVDNAKLRGTVAELEKKRKAAQISLA